ncbi:MAG: MATE family efflux transporter [Ignavibacteriales bacterium]|nr:MATE family efflux transporter [Ignavibacteriales bacterium]
MQQVLHVIVARRFGQGNFLECGNTLNNSLILSLLIGGVVAAIGASLAGPIAHFFASDDIVGDYASSISFL